MATTQRSVLEYYYTDSAGTAIGWIEARVFSQITTEKTKVNMGSGITATATTLTVDNGALFSVGDVIQVGNARAGTDELMYISAISTHNLTVSRGFNKTLNIAHADDTSVYLTIPGNALLQFDISHEINASMQATVTLSNFVRELYPTTTDISHLGTKPSRRQGPFHDVFNDFTAIRVRDSFSKAMLFYGIVTQTNERQDFMFGPVILLHAEDYLLELKENSLRTGFNYLIDNSQNVHISLQRADALSVEEKFQKTYDSGVSTRGGLIKSLLSHTSAHIDAPMNTTGGNDKRFTESVVKFPAGTPAYEVGKRRRKNILAHIEELAAEDPHATSTNSAAPSAAEVGYDYYLDHNITSTSATASNPANPHKMYFNYFKRGTRPNPNEDVARYGLKVEYPYYYSNRTDQSDSATATNAFVGNGHTIPMIEYDFARPKNNVFTSAEVDYVSRFNDDDGDTVLDTHTAKFECIEIKAGVGLDDFKWNLDGSSNEYTIAEGVAGTDSAEFLEFNTGSGYVDVGRIQWISDTNTAGGGDFTAAAPTRKILISDIPLTSLTNANIWAEDAVWRGKTTTASTVTVKRVPRVAFNLEKSVEIVGSSSDTYTAIRQRVAAALTRDTTEIVQGTIQTYAAPLYYFDSSVASIGSTSSTTQTFTLSNDTLNSTGAAMNPQNYGITIGMCVAKLSGDDPTSTYGYLSAVTTSTVTVTWATGIVSADPADSIRFYIPLKAGDTIHVRNDHYKFTGSMLVSRLEYRESTGQTETVLTVSGVDNTSASIASRIGEKSKVNMGSHFADDATSLIVDDGSAFAVHDIILADDELMKVSAISSNTLTVSREYLDTKAVQHDDNTSIYTVTAALASAGPRASLASFIGATNKALGNLDILPKQQPGELDASTISTTNVFTVPSTNQVDWAAGTIGYKGEVIPIDAGTTAGTMVSSANGNTGQSGTTLATGGVKYIVYYDGNQGGSATGAGAFKTIRSAAYGALAATKNNLSVPVAYVQYDAGGAILTVLGKASASATNILDSRVKKAPFGTAALPAYSFSNNTNTGMYRGSASNELSFSSAGSRRLSIKSANVYFYQDDGNTAILTMTTSNGNVDVHGALTKGSGTFKIDHPLDKDNKYLYHSFIEGPQYDLLYRGKVTLVGGTATVNIDTVSNMTEGTFVALTQNPDYYLQNNTGWDAVKGSISGNTLTITCQNSSSTDTISWMVVAERADDHIKATQLSDSDGHLIPEWNKSDID